MDLVDIAEHLESGELVEDLLQARLSDAVVSDLEDFFHFLDGPEELGNGQPRPVESHKRACAMSEASREEGGIRDVRTVLETRKRQQ